MGFAKAVSGLKTFKQRLQFRPRTFIVPTGFGLVFGVVCLVLLFLALGYQNNVVYAFTFFLISIGHTAMILTNQNMERVRIGEVAGVSLFANEPSELSIEVRNIKSKPSLNIKIFVGEKGYVEPDPPTHEFRLDPHQLLNPIVKWTPAKRGWQTAPKIVAQSTYPFGLLRSWRELKPMRDLLVYPARRGPLPLPALPALLGSNDLLFKGFKAFADGDSPNRVDWRASSRHQSLLVRTYESEEGTGEVELDWHQTSSLNDFEARVSQLALWVDQLERAGVPYALKLGTRKFEAAIGARHFSKCLSALALLTERHLDRSSDD